MKTFIIALFFSTSAFAATWIQAPGGVLPTKVPDGNAYESEMLCGEECVDVSRVPDLEVAKIQGKEAVPDEAKFNARQAARAAAEATALAVKADADTKKGARKNIAKLVKDVADPAVKQVLKAIIEELGMDK